MAPQITQCRFTESVHSKIPQIIDVITDGFVGGDRGVDSGRGRRGDPIIMMEVSGLCVRRVGELGGLSMRMGAAECRLSWSRRSLKAAAHPVESIEVHPY